MGGVARGAPARRRWSRTTGSCRSGSSSTTPGPTSTRSCAAATTSSRTSCAPWRATPPTSARCSAPSSRPGTRPCAATATCATRAGPERTLVHSLKSLLALAEAYPDLKADAHFLELQRGARHHRGPHPGRPAPLQRQRARLQPAGRSRCRPTSWPRSAGSGAATTSSWRQPCGTPARPAWRPPDAPRASACGSSPRRPGPCSSLASTPRPAPRRSPSSRPRSAPGSAATAST